VAGVCNRMLTLALSVCSPIDSCFGHLGFLPGLCLCKHCNKVLQCVTLKHCNKVLQCVTLKELHKRNKRQVPTENLSVGDMVVIKDDNRIHSFFRGADGYVGVVEIRTARSEVSEVP